MEKVEDITHRVKNEEALDRALDAFKKAYKPILKCNLCEEDQLGDCWTPHNYVICLACYGKFFEPLGCDQRILLIHHITRKNRMIYSLASRV